jgi:hypothetical protein
MVLPVTLIMFYLNPVAANIANLEDFESYSSGAFPTKWRARSEEAKKIYRVGQENGNHFLRAHADKQAVQIGLEHIFTPQAHTRLGWRWRVLTFPTGADERRAHLHDAAAQVYVVFDNQYWPRIIKYIWSTRLALGSRFVNPLYGRGWVVVLRSGPADKEAWNGEEINFLDDYRKLFGAEPEKVQGIGILTSSDATQSVATADYDDFTLLP